MIRILQVLNILQLYLIVTWIDLWLRVVALVVRALENMSAEWVNCNKAKVITLRATLLNVSNVLHRLVQVLHLAAILLNRRACVRHTEHLKALGLIGLLVR